MSTTYADLGYNKTGIATAPRLSEEMLEGTKEFLPALAGDEREIARVREIRAKEADPLGTVPPPIGVGSAVKAATRGIRGLRPTQFLDKLGERLAFERTGVRLYNALISKFDVFGGFEGAPTRAKLEETMLEEHEHLGIVSEAIAKLGGDPTVITPSADFHATLTKGVLEVMVDPRTSFAQCLEAILVAELADNECWETLVELARQSGESELERRFIVARQQEAEHLSNVRTWIAAAQKRTEPDPSE